MNFILNILIKDNLKYWSITLQFYILINMQKLILVTLILGLAFFLYLIKTGEVDSNDFNIKKLQNPISFTIKKSEIGGKEIASTIYINIQETAYQVYTFTGSSFEHIPKSEYYMKQYDIPLEAIDAVTGNWLGSRYIFYVTQEGKDLNAIYRIYKTEYPTDSTDPVTYREILNIKGSEASNRVEVKY